MKTRRRRFVGVSLLVLVLLGFIGCGRSPSSVLGTSTTNVQVTETDFHIHSTVTSFSPGIPYQFVVTNKGQTTHEFMIMPKSEGAMPDMAMGDMDKMAFASISNLRPGETKTLDYTFPSLAAGSHPEFASYLPGHYEAGIKQGITVKS